MIYCYVPGGRSVGWLGRACEGSVDSQHLCKKS